MKASQISMFTQILEAMASPIRLELTVTDGTYVAHRPGEDAAVGRLNMDGDVLTGLEVIASEPGQVASFLLKAICNNADRKNKMLAVPSMAIIAGSRASRFMELFGFRNEGNNMVRRPGAVLPGSAIF